MRITNITQENYTTYQLVLPLDLGLKIPEDDELRTYCELMKGIELKKYFNKESTQGRKRKNRVAILNSVLFGFMIDIRSSRKIQKACKTDIRFMYLLGDIETPSHTTINEVIKGLELSIDDLFMEIFLAINQRENINTDITYIDGTKIEADANRYTFVWKKAVIKNKKRLDNKVNKDIFNVLELLHTNNKDFIVKESYTSHDLDELASMLEYICYDSEVEFVYGKGKRKHPLQRIYEEYYEYSQKMHEYERHLDILGSRNSYSKTDHDATFMRMKTDHMKNGQLKAGYNVQMSVSDEYITLIDIFDNRSDHGTFIPFMEKYKNMHGHYPTKPVADAGYGSYDNYYFCLEHDLGLYQKYNTWSKEKKRSYKTNKFLKHNFKKDVDGNYICPNNKRLLYQDTYSSARCSYPTSIKRYVCEDCSDCKLKTNCTRAKTNRTIQINDTLDQMHEQVRVNLNSDDGINLRIQRSIQVEGAFGVIKEDMKFRRFTRVLKNGVKLEISLIAVGYNLKKFHNKKYRSNKLLQ